MFSVYVIFLRFHNYIAHALHNWNPSWTDEQLFKYARRINIAMYQHVLWEYVELLVGKIFYNFYEKESGTNLLANL